MNNVPDILQIEITNICNANCIFCAYQFDQREKGIINFDLFKDIVKTYKIFGGKKISLSPFAGEIFVDPNVIQKINFIREQNFELVFTYTNALLLHKFSMSDILTSGLTKLYISLAPLDKETYIKIYRNNNYEQLLKNLSNLLKSFNNIKNKTLESLHIEFRSNIKLSEIKKLPDYIKYIEPYINEHIMVSSMDFFDSWMGKIQEEDLLEGMTIKNHNFDKPTPCRRLDTLQVMANGDARICGCRYNHNANKDIFTIGNIKNENIISIYNKRNVSDIKQSFYESKIPLECQLCSWYEGI